MIRLEKVEKLMPIITLNIEKLLINFIYRTKR